MPAQTPDTPSDDPTLAELLELLARSVSLALRSSAPATVTAYNAATGTATVTLGAVPVLLTRTGDEVPQAPIVLPDVPVAWLGSLTGGITTPLTPGSTGWVLFADRAIERWLATGAPGDPALPRAHSLADGIFLPVRIGVGTAAPTSTTATVIAGPRVNLRAGATHPLVWGDTLAAAFTAWTGAVASAGSTWAGVAPPTAISNGAFIGSLIGATATLAGTIAGWLSASVLTR